MCTLINASGLMFFINPLSQKICFTVDILGFRVMQPFCPLFCNVSWAIDVGPVGLMYQLGLGSHHLLTSALCLVVVPSDGLHSLWRKLFLTEHFLYNIILITNSFPSPNACRSFLPTHPPNSKPTASSYSFLSLLTFLSSHCWSPVSLSLFPISYHQSSTIPPSRQTMLLPHLCYMWALYMFLAPVVSPWYILTFEYLELAPQMRKNMGHSPFLFFFSPWWEKMVCRLQKEGSN